MRAGCAIAMRTTPYSRPSRLSSSAHGLATGLPETDRGSVLQVWWISFYRSYTIEMRWERHWPAGRAQAAAAAVYCGPAIPQDAAPARTRPNGVLCGRDAQKSWLRARQRYMQARWAGRGKRGWPWKAKTSHASLLLSARLWHSGRLAVKAYQRHREFPAHGTLSDAPGGRMPPR